MRCLRATVRPAFVPGITQPIPLTSQVSQFTYHRISLRRAGRFIRFLKFKQALSYVARGDHRWIDPATIEYTRYAKATPVQCFAEPPKNAHFLWQPGMSDNFLVLKAKWGRAVPEDHPDYIWSGPNYGKPHKPVVGEYDGIPRESCLCCGKWLDGHGD